MGLRRRWIKFLNRMHLEHDRRTVAGGARDLTSGKIELNDLTIKSENSKAGIFYLPSPWAVLGWMHAALPQAKEQWTFVDLGAGIGRAALSAARHPYARVVGVEFAGELAAAARAVIAAAGKQQAGSVEIVHMDAVDYVLPNGPVIVFLFDPFEPPVIDRVAESIARSYGEEPRPIIVAYLHPRHSAVFDALDGFVVVKGRLRARLLLRMLSPYRLKLYATPECLSAWR